MELSHKTTILLTPRLHETLKRLASIRGCSIGELIRSACEEQYGLVPESDAAAAVDALSSFSLPVADVTTMKHESVPPISGPPQ